MKTQARPGQDLAFLTCSKKHAWQHGITSFLPFWADSLVPASDGDSAPTHTFRSLYILPQIQRQFYLDFAYNDLLGTTCTCRHGTWYCK